MTSDRASGGPLRVAIVEDHPLMAAGVERALTADPTNRFRVVGTFTSIAALDPASTGVVYDVCVLDLMGVGTQDDIGTLLSEKPVVVYTAGEPGPLYVALWARGARAVLNKKTVVGPPLAEAVRYAIDDPYVVGPQLAQALLDQTLSQAVDVGRRPRSILEAAATGDPPERIVADLRIDRARYETDIDSVRRACTAAGLNAVDLSGAFGAGPVPADRPLNTALALLTPSQRPTRTQREMLILLANGYTEQEIAANRTVEYLTVRNTLRDALNRAGIARQDKATRILYAVFIAGHHRDPELLLERLRGRGIRADPGP